MRRVIRSVSFHDAERLTQRVAPGERDFLHLSGCFYLFFSYLGVFCSEQSLFDGIVIRIPFNCSTLYPIACIVQQYRFVRVLSRELQVLLYTSVVPL